MTGKPSLPRLLSSRRRQPTREGRTRGKQAPERNLRGRKFRYTLPGPRSPDRRTRRTKARNQPPAPGKNHPYVRCAGNNPQATLPRRSLTVSRTAGETDIVSHSSRPRTHGRSRAIPARVAVASPRLPCFSRSRTFPYKYRLHPDSGKKLVRQCSRNSGAPGISAFLHAYPKQRRLRLYAIRFGTFLLDFGRRGNILWMK